MQHYQQGKQIQTRKAVLIFLKHVAPPIILYVDEPDELYQEVRQIISKASPATPKLIENIGKGPLKKVSALDIQIAGVAIQEEPFMG